jgi:hypothetical protein
MGGGNSSHFIFGETMTNKDKYCKVCGALLTKYNERREGFDASTGDPIIKYDWRCSVNPCHQGHVMGEMYVHRRPFFSETEFANDCIYCKQKFIRRQE